VVPLPATAPGAFTNVAAMPSGTPLFVVCAPGSDGTLTPGMTAPDESTTCRRAT
jgi:hypothetical protein